MPPSFFTSSFLRFIDFFAAPKDRDSDPEIFYRRRLLSGILVTDAALLWGFLVYVCFLSSTGTENIIAALIIALPMITVLSGLLWYLRFGGNYLFASHLLVLIMYAGTMAGITISGGPLVSDSSFMLVVPAILAYCLTGWISGSIWTILIFLSQSLFAAFMSTNNPALPVYGDPGTLPAIKTINWLLSFLATISLVMIYERMTQTLKENLERQRNTAEHLAKHDNLTSLPNRAYFDQELPRAALRADRTNESMALLYIDLDGFKPINDQYGHDAGDLVLRAVAERIRNSIRRTDFPCRIGGDEFAIIAENIHKKEDIEVISKKLLEKIKQPIKGIPDSPFVTASIGVATYPEDTRDIEMLRQYADQVMYQAKKEHSTYVIFAESND